MKTVLIFISVSCYLKVSILDSNFSGARRRSVKITGSRKKLGNAALDITNQIKQIVEVKEIWAPQRKLNCLCLCVADQYINNYN